MFNPESLFWRIISRGVDIVGLSLLWAALSLPIVTCGAASSALYYTIVKCFRQNERETFHIYWNAFKENLKQGFWVSVIVGILLLVLAFGYSIMRSNWSTSFGQFMFVVYDILLVIPLGTVCYLFPMQGRFFLPFRLLFMNSFAMAMKHIPTTVVLTLMVIESAIFSLQYWFPILFMPVVITWISSLFLEKIFAKYLTQEQKEVFDPGK